MKQRFVDPPPEIAAIDLTRLIDAIRLHGTMRYGSNSRIANRIYRAEALGVIVVTDHNRGKGLRVHTESWEARGYRDAYGFQCTSFRGSIETCMAEATMLRITL
ncbi:MAG: hypothetical protein EOO77_37665 [Oxalobacteraceae bacterium]|nr:MAG: hypothetical protein EOO77_37665 [Oxalobacteraceae bacterium]